MTIHFALSTMAHLLSPECEIQVLSGAARLSGEKADLRLNDISENREAGLITALHGGVRGMKQDGRRREGS